MTTLIERLHLEEQTILSEVEQFYTICEIVRESNVEALEVYLSKGYNINVRNSQNIRSVIHDDAFCQTTPEFAALLVSKGLDLFALNFKGSTVLHNLFLEYTTNDLILYVLSKGVNIHQSDFNGVDPTSEGSFLNKERRELFKEFLEQKFEEITYEHAIRDKNFALALSIVQGEVSSLGGLGKILVNLGQTDLRNTIKKYYNALALNGKYGDALTLIEVYDQELGHRVYSYDETSPLGLAVPLILEDEFVAGKLIKHLRIVSEEGYGRDWIIYYGLVLCFLNEDIDPELYDSLKEAAHVLANNEESYLSPFYDALLTKSEETARNLSIQLSSEIPNYKHAFALGLLYLKNNDLFNAEYMFMKTLEIAPKYMLSVPQVIIEANVLLNYLQQKRED